MKTKKIALLLLLLGFAGANLLCAQKLTVSVSNIKPTAGNLMVGVFNKENGFPDVYYKGAKISAADTAMTVTFTDLPKGKYAVSAYLDVNKNGQLDKNFLGIPKEKYGFSNKANNPDYKESIFDFHSDITIRITLK
ncbi:MAG: DUF2141 domain-containing protein [Prevotellaceae bacterium]|jgi:uncharacterized protein (DUF2141 family)|nr:DUF2141 domain-containing protein [Prevotellaceae bacterium]